MVMNDKLGGDLLLFQVCKYGMDLELLIINELKKSVSLFLSELPHLHSVPLSQFTLTFCPKPDQQQENI